MSEDSFQQNISGAQDLVESDTNKAQVGSEGGEAVGEYEDLLDLPMTNEELLKLRDEYEIKNDGYAPKIKPRQDKNKLYYTGKQRASGLAVDKVVPSNLIFESEETFIPQALSKNPEPVVWSDNTNEGKEESNDVKTMLQFHADVLCLRKKLGVMVRHWSIYFLGVLKHGWDSKANDIKTELRNPKNFVLDPDGYIDEFGDYVGAFLGERIKCSASDLIKMYPDSEKYITLKVAEKMGTECTRTEWWTNEYCFTTFFDEVLDKHKNEFFNYEDDAMNHFANPKMPYTFLSVFSLQEHPHDETNLIEQNISNQDRINDRDEQISKNLASANNSVVLSGTAFTSENAGQARDTFYEEGFLLVPNGDVDKAVKRLPANDLPSAIFTAQENDKNTLRSVFGTQGLVPDQDKESTARGQILNQSHDSTRIGGGIGDALEQVADNVFNWWVQLYYVLYDEPHYASIIGSGRAVEYVRILKSNLNRRFVVSVSPNSMQPKDEITEQNLSIQLAESGWLDPLSLYQKLNYADPVETAMKVMLYKTNPQAYMQQYLGQQAPQGQPAPQGEGQTPEQPGSPPETLGAPPASSSLSNVPINTLSAP